MVCIRSSAKRDSLGRQGMTLSPISVIVVHD